MGRSFKKELSSINDTYNWAKTVDIDILSANLEELMGKPTFVVGSGGSFSACHMFSLLQQSKGTFSKPITPLELHYSANSIRNANVFFLSASGRNSDILFAYNSAVKQDPRNVFGLCMRKDTKLLGIAVNHSISKIIELNNPAGKDGFLATNSLIAYFTILSRMFGYPVQANDFHLEPSEQKEINEFVQKLDENFTLVTLYAGWSQPVAIDIESKFTEAGLGNILYSDFRNFGHGRHNWFDKKTQQSAILALVTPDERQLAEKTLSLLPDYIPKLILSTNYSHSPSTIDLLIKSFYLANAVGEKVGIDPGRPGVPSYGSKLYHLRYLSLVDSKKYDLKTINAILRKTSKKTIDELENTELVFWKKRLSDYKEKINKAKFGALILDYDGTLCTKDERKEVPSTEVVNLLNTYLGKGFIVGIVTGRGKSIRESLAKCIDKKLWGNMIIGYYNGAIIARLSEELQPDTSMVPHDTLQLIYDFLNQQNFYQDYILSLRPLQLTIENNKRGGWDTVKQMILEKTANLQSGDIQVLESVHSLDIIVRPQVSKKNIIKYCVEECEQKGLSENFICIGDKGRFPGNDYELLAAEYSLSVDEVSSDPDTCWNLSDIGKRGVSTCLQYLNSTKFHKTHFTLTL